MHNDRLSDAMSDCTGLVGAFRNAHTPYDKCVGRETAASGWTWSAASVAFGARLQAMYWIIQI